MSGIASTESIEVSLDKSNLEEQTPILGVFDQNKTKRMSHWLAGSSIINKLDLDFTQLLCV